jgi:hypothetical protein
MKNANYRKHNDRSQNSSTYHKKDGTPIRAILKRETEKEIKLYWQDGFDGEPESRFDDVNYGHGEFHPDTDHVDTIRERARNKSKL